MFRRRLRQDKPFRQIKSLRGNLIGWLAECHGSGGAAEALDLSTHANLTAAAAKAATAIVGGAIPQAGSEQRVSFDEETEGKANLLEYLKASAP